MHYDKLIIALVLGSLATGCAAETSTTPDEPAGGGGLGAGGGAEGGGTEAGGSDTGGSDTGGSDTGGSDTGGAGGSIDPGEVGNCIVEGDEQCDDCNTEPTDGCDAQGAIEPGWACPEPGQACLHVSGFTGVDPQPAAGLLGSLDGGTPYERSCAAGSVLVGFEIEDASSCACASPNAQIGSLLPVCAPLSVGMEGAFFWEPPGALLDRIGGVQGVGAPLGALLCDPSEMVVGLHGAIGAAYDDVAALSIDCAPLSYDRVLGDVVLGAATTTATSGLGATSQDVLCPTGQVVETLSGTHGAVVDALAASCVTPQPTFCGDGVVDPHEACDDGNPFAGDGCDTLCQLEPGWACPQADGPCLHVSGFDLGSETMLGTLGNLSGGVPYDVSCPAGTALTGFTVEDAQSCACAGDPSRVGSLVPRCAAVDVSASGDMGWSAASTLLDRLGGNQGIGQPLGDLLCAQDEFVVGLRGAVGPSYGEVAGLAIDCAKLRYEPSAAGGSLATTAAITSPTLGAAPTIQAQACGPDAIVSRLTGKEGAVVDGIVQHCSSLLPTFCGDGVVDVQEDCDDGNSQAGDGCDATCRAE